MIWPQREGWPHVVLVGAMSFLAVVKTLSRRLGAGAMLCAGTLAHAQGVPVAGSAAGVGGYPADQGWRSLGGVQAYSVRPAGHVQATPLPDVPVSAGATSDDPIESMIARDGSPYGSLMPGEPLPGAVSAELYGNGGMSAQPYVPEQYSWDYVRQSSWRERQVSRSSPGLLGGIRLSPATTTGGSNLPWSVGVSSWSFTGTDGPAISIGSQSVGMPDWARGAKLGGVNVADSSLSGPDVDHIWNYSVAVGAIDGAPTASQGDLAYGAGAGYAMLGYGLTPDIKLQSQMEVAPSLVSTGLGGTIQTDWGAWTAGVSRATGGLYKGWRYQAGYSVTIAEDIRLGWLNESSTAGYSDLSTYESGPAAGSATRHKLSATIPASRWGTISGSFETINPASGDPVRSFGLTQQFWYSPNLQIGLDAKREIVSGDYDVGIRFSVPVF